MTFTAVILNAWCDLIQTFSMLTDLGKNTAGDFYQQCRGCFHRADSLLIGYPECNTLQHLKKLHCGE